MKLNDNFDFSSLSYNEENLFKLNPQNILSRNRILNYIGNVGFEISMFGFSTSANDIATFYEELKIQKGLKGIEEFKQNKVINLILETVKNKPYIKNYLDERIFDLIEQDKIYYLENLFKNSKKILKNNKKLEENAKKQEEKPKKAKKIEVSKDNFIQMLLNDLENDLEGENKKIKGIKIKEISLDKIEDLEHSLDEEDDENLDENFWEL